MQSLFSRARTNSTPFKNAPPLSPNDSPVSLLDDFGRVQSRNSNRAIAATSFTPTKKDKKKAKDLAKRAKTLGARVDQLDNELEQQQQALPDGSFLPFSLEQPIAEGEQSRETDYGYLSYERHVVLGLEQLEMLVNVVVEELEKRGGITTPFIFSTTALDISASAIKRLIRCFLNFCSARGGDTERAWRDEARFAGPHELGMCLRWGLARVVRVSAGADVRGLIAWDIYLRFRDSEAANGYPPGQFEMLLDELDPIVQVIVVRVLSLLTRLTANSTSSGHTPPTLSPLFGPLLFGLGPATLAFHHTYMHYIRAVNAAEHILLAFIRWQDTPRLAASNTMYPSSSAAALGVPIRLKEWIKGYPAMLPFLHEQQKNVKPQPRKGAKTVTLTTVRRNVRMYSPDLVKSAATWAHRSKSSNGVINGLANSKEWERIAPATLKLPPRYSETYKKRMNLPPDFHPDTAPGVAYSKSGSSSNTNTSLSTLHAPILPSALTIGTLSPTNSTASNKDYFGLGTREGEDRFKNLTDLKWGEFESMGFSGIGDEKKLQFDLTEGAREARALKRSTMSWNDFSAAGFSRTDVPLNATLQFSTSLTQSVSSWPGKDAELTKKLKKTEKQLPPFGWDTEPVMGNEEIVEESFVDVFCDLVYGGGWMDLERGESLDRDVNWALVEFKSLPTSNRGTVAGGSDPRTNTTLILFEEFVPFEYRQQLAIKSTTRRRLPSLFSPSKKQWKQAATLNGRPYVVGHVPRSPSYREMEFEGLLQGGSGTKVISLGGTKTSGGTSVGTGTRVSAITTATTATTGHGHGYGQGLGSDGMREQLPPVPPLPPQPVSSQGGTQSNALFASTSTNNKRPLGSNTLPRSIIPQTPPKQQSRSGGDEHQSFTSESTTTHTHAHTSTSMMSPSPATKKSASSRFKITNVMSTIPSPKRLSTAMVPPAEYSEVQFETRLASYSDSERNSGGDSDDLGKNARKKKRESRDDAWVDILVNSHNRRMVGQDVDLSKNGSGVGKGVGGGPDPDMASLEVAQVLAAVRHRRNGSISSSSSFSTGGPQLRNGDEDDEDVVREHGPSIDMDAHVEGLEIDEIERVPRRLRSSESAESDDRNKRLAYEDEYAADDEDVDADVDAQEYSQDFSHGHERSASEHESRPIHSTPQSKQATQTSHSTHTPPPSQRGGRRIESEDQDEDSPLLSVRHGLRQQRRVGYFDLHPERKQLYSSPSYDLDLDEEHPQPQQATTGAGVSVTSYGSPSPDVPSFDSSIERRKAEMERSGVVRADSVTIPSTKSSFENGHASGVTQTSSSTISTPGTMASTATAIGTPTAAVILTASASSGGSTATTTASALPAHPIGPRAPASATASSNNGTKTAQLIEMYRERERRAASSTPPASAPPASAPPASSTTTPTATATVTTTTTTGPAPSKIPVLVATMTPTTTPAPASASASAPATVPSSIPPLRVPARSASLPGATNPNAHISSPLPEPPAGVVQPTIPAVSTTIGVKVDELIEPPPRVPFEKTGRASPARYVHGAPLHNVLEEEEEEE